MASSSFISVQKNILNSIFLQIKMLNFESISKKKTYFVIVKNKTVEHFVSHLVSLANKTCDEMLVSMFSDAMISLIASDKPLSLKFKRSLGSSNML